MGTIHSTCNRICNSGFLGSLDGNGHIISGLKVDNTVNNEIGLFSSTTGATFSNLGLENFNVSGNWYVGGLIGFDNGGTIINKVHFTGIINSNGNAVGGIIGDGEGTILENVYSSGKIVGASGDFKGGIAGNLIGEIDNAYSTMNVSGRYYEAGILGQGLQGAMITDSFATGFMNSTADFAGYIAGSLLTGSDINNVYLFDNGDGVPCVAYGGSGGCMAESPKSFFYDINNQPMGGWDFNTIWSKRFNGIDYPTLQGTGPVLNLIEPSNNIYYTSTASKFDTSSVYLKFNATANNGLSSVWWNNGTADIPYTSPIHFNLLSGQYNWTINANDTLSNYNSQSISFFVNTPTPPYMLCLGWFDGAGAFSGLIPEIISLGILIVVLGIIGLVILVVRNGGMNMEFNESEGLIGILNFKGIILGLATVVIIMFALTIMFIGMCPVH